MEAYGLGTDPQARMLDLSSEVGELAKEVLKATGYGTRPLAPTPSMEEELGDCLASASRWVWRPGPPWRKCCQNISGALRKAGR